MNGDAIDPLVVRHDLVSHHFEVVTPDGHVVGHHTYDPVPAQTAGGRGMFVAIHTVLAPDSAGRGVAALLACAALDYARSQRLTVIAECPCIRAFIERHAEYQDLVP